MPPIGDIPFLFAIKWEGGLWYILQIKIECAIKIELEEYKLKKTIKGYLFGFLSATILISGVTYAANTTTLYDVVANGIKIVIDGQKINPTDANGNTVEPFIYNGTTYLPIRAVANAFGKEVYWDGANYTVYLGKMNGVLEYASKELSVNDSIGNGFGDARNNRLYDNYGNNYSRAIINSQNSFGGAFDVICNYKYSSLKGTIYVAKGYSGSATAQITIKTDGKTIYTSPQINKSTAPIPLNLNVTGCNELELICENDADFFDNLCIGELGLYQ